MTTLGGPGARQKRVSPGGFHCRGGRIGFFGGRIQKTRMQTRAGRDSIRSAAQVEVAESGDRQKQKHYQAWQVLNTAQCKDGSGGGIKALQELNHDHIPLVGIHAAGAFLQGIQLHGANLLRADLSAADPRDANLYAVDLQYANLTWTNFRQADMSRANLEGEAWKDIRSIKGEHSRKANRS